MPIQYCRTTLELEVVDHGVSVATITEAGCHGLIGVREWAALHATLGREVTISEDDDDYWPLISVYRRGVHHFA